MVSLRLQSKAEKGEYWYLAHFLPFTQSSTVAHRIDGLSIVVVSVAIPLLFINFFLRLIFIFNPCVCVYAHTCAYSCVYPCAFMWGKISHTF